MNSRILGKSNLKGKLRIVEDCDAAKLDYRNYFLFNLKFSGSLIQMDAQVRIEIREIVLYRTKLMYYKSNICLVYL